MFDKLIWSDDKMIFNDLVFRIEHTKNDNWDSDENHFIFYKIKTLIDQYDTYFKENQSNFAPKNVLELGMWDGGSAAFWNEILKPNKLVGVDLLDTGGGSYFNKYLDSKKSKKIIPYWSTDQGDRSKITDIIKSNFGDEPIDLVFDDASHMYEPSIASFNIIFPYLAEGGLYIIEDWAWGHWKGFESMFPPNSEPTKLIFELVQASGNVGLIESLTIYQGFVVVKRGKEAIPGEKSSFALKNYIYNRSKGDEYFGYLKGGGLKQKIKTMISILKK